MREVRSPRGVGRETEFHATVRACSELDGKEASGSGVEKKERDCVMLLGTYRSGGGGNRIELVGDVSVSSV